jgi:hypothetical protein
MPLGPEELPVEPDPLVAEISGIVLLPDALHSLCENILVALFGHKIERTHAQHIALRRGT